MHGRPGKEMTVDRPHARGKSRVSWVTSEGGEGKRVRAEPRRSKENAGPHTIAFRAQVGKKTISWSAWRGKKK